MTLQQLKELSERATPGPWSFKEGDNQINSPKKAVALAAGDNNTQFIAASNPKTVLQLIDRVEKLSKAISFYVYDGGDDAGETGIQALDKYGADVELK